MKPIMRFYNAIIAAYKDRFSISLPALLLFLATFGFAGAANAAPLTYVASAKGVNTVTLPSHQAGDVLIAWAIRDGSSTPPSLPAGWTRISPSNLCCNSLGFTLAWKVASTSNETVGTFSNASSLIVSQYRPGNGYSVSIGAYATGGSSSAVNASYPALTLQTTDGSSWVLGFFGHRSPNIGSLASAPTGMTTRATDQDAIDSIAVHDSAGGVSSWAATNVVHTGTASTFRTAVLELKVTGNPVSEQLDLFDSFESANLSAPDGPYPALNTSGFSWGGTNWTSIVTMINGVPTAVWNGSVVNRAFPDSDFNCYDSSHCLRFHFAAGGDTAEQRFDLGKAYPDVWFRYWIRVPTNFYHSEGNNKFAAFWTADYDGPGDVTWQTRSVGDGNAKLVVQDGGVAVGEIDAGDNFITLADRGRWMQVVIRLIPATSSTANNGTIQFYRRWSNEPNFSLLYNKTNASFYEGGQGIHAGYLMGWANARYTEITEWLVDGFTVAPESLLNDSSTGTPVP